jgi:hypothetical protein
MKASALESNADCAGGRPEVEQLTPGNGAVLAIRERRDRPIQRTRRQFWSYSSQK